MMTLRDLINKLLGRETASANTARERLQLVLAHFLEIRLFPIIALIGLILLFSANKIEQK